jgi:hypothetical protein
MRECPDGRMQLSRPSSAVICPDGWMQLNELVEKLDAFPDRRRDWQSLRQLGAR